ncbi:tetratricopeptide repeat protein [Streptosporangium sp. NBC_01756]|uniref:tetratricopeptide repeat protein n=1 Tax=Streptosporangium sp. NBC_01756 TaxID=2975950 RepID=UPI002DDC4E5B|nr:tetratricopeptide repeat protein [Streptosporangium sp. NBC_01756]WSC89467.1 tetratricopeptide repeat protein [Streptosporangium sp. NBC_01756]
MITTRRRVSWPDGVVRLPLDLLEQDAATELLIRTSERSADPDERLAFAALAAELGYLPLALQQAGAYIREAGIISNQYLKLLADHPLYMYRASPEQDDAQQTIARLWNAHLDLIRSRNQNAEQILRVLACYAPENIPRDIIGGPGVAGGPAILDALRLLASYSLITLGEQTLTMHRLLQAVLVATDDIHSHNATGGPASPQLALAWLAEAWSAAEELPPQQQTSKYQLLGTHAESLTRHYSITFITGEHDWIFPKVALFEYEQGNYHRAEPLARHAVAITLAGWGKEHPDTLTTRNNLALVLQGLGRLQEAEAEHRAVLGIRRRVLGEEHPDTLAGRNNLASALQELGRLQEAEAEHRAVLGIRRRVLGEEHPDTLISRHNLASVLQGLGRLEEAEAEGRAVWQASRQVLGEEHPDTLASRGNLALVLQGLGRLEEAEAEGRAVWQASRQVLGEEHPDTLISRNNLEEIIRERTKRRRIETCSRLGNLDRNAPCACGSGKKHKRCHGKGR